MTQWDQNLLGTIAARPAANTVPRGTTYFATDNNISYISDSATWITTGSGAIVLSASNVVVPHGGNIVTSNIAALPTANNVIYTLVVHCSDLGAGETEGDNFAATIGWQLQEFFGQLVGKIINQAGADRHVSWAVIQRFV